MCHCSTQPAISSLETSRMIRLPLGSLAYTCKSGCDRSPLPGSSCHCLLPPVVARLHLPLPEFASLHLRLLASACHRLSPLAIARLPSPPAIARLQSTFEFRLRSLASSCHRLPPPPPAIGDRLPPLAPANAVIARLHLQSLASTCGLSPPPAIAHRNLRSLASACNR